MVETAEHRLAAPTPLPDHAVVPPVWGRITNLDVDRGEGSWLITRDGERYLDYSSGIGVTNTGHAHPRVAAAIARAGHQAAPRPAEHPVPRARPAAVRPSPDGCSRAGRGRRSCPTPARRRSRRRSSWRGSRPGRPAIMAFRYGYHGRTAQTMALTTRPRTSTGPPSSRCPGSVYHTAYPYCYRAAGGAHAPDGLHLRLGGAARPDLPPVHLPGQGRGDHHRAGPRRGRLRRPAAGLPAASPRDHPASTASCSSPTRSRPGSGGPARCSRSSTGTWSRTSSSWPRASRPACRCPGILARQELMAAWKPGTHGGTYGGNVVSCAAANATLDVIEDEGLVANARERGDQFLAGLRALAGEVPRRSATSRGLGPDGRASSSSSRASATAASRTRT